MDAASRRATMQARTMQAEVSYAYDNANRSTGVTQGTTSVSFVYDADTGARSRRCRTGITADLYMGCGFATDSHLLRRRVDQSGQSDLVTTSLAISAPAPRLAVSVDPAGRRDQRDL